MSDWAAPSSGRWIKVLCLHGVEQSAASFRAQLGQITNSLPGNWQFHFLDAPHVALVDHPASSSSSDVWARAAGLHSLICTLSPNHLRSKAASQELGTADLSTVSGAIEHAYESGGIDEVESLVGRKSGKSCERCWSFQFAPRCEGGSELTAGLDATLSLVGDYMREHGPFDGFVGTNTGFDVLYLVQSLLTYPVQGSKHYPSFFPQLPGHSKRLPRMGGYDTSEDPMREPGAKETLPAGYAATQGPFKFGIIKEREPGKVWIPSGIGTKASEWIMSRFASTETLRVPENSTAAGWTEYISRWLQATAAAADGDAEAQAALQALSAPGQSRPDLTNLAHLPSFDKLSGELNVLYRTIYKSKAQHEKSKAFQTIDGVRRAARGLNELEAECRTQLKETRKLGRKGSDAKVREQLGKCAKILQELAAVLGEVQRRSKLAVSHLKAHLRTPPAPTFAPFIVSASATCSGVGVEASALFEACQALIGQVVAAQNRIEHAFAKRALL
ncbi:OVARIAN CANCER-ASSOCIATED GENE 2 PROTEIN [Ceraceosorus bombacis]|uniref:OVARIAN CANCER-ASSOCIATED GENE 2 PROTEIN n=1 Tax=Ceraceosorus bombacis TaxID=401625 RepID=A0A0P1BGL6_9BASI|nr:OVARIAN CANCER-ASSOCIATED GENE 2 PROTEIN [Ceraceosorus bombacis]